MTDKEILQACEMRLDGKSWEYISEKLYYERSTVAEMVKRRVFSGKAGKVKSVHPYVRRWMCNENVSGEMIAKEAGVIRGTVYANLQKPVIGKKVAEAICRMSGMSMEQVQELDAWNERVDK